MPSSHTQTRRERTVAPRAYTTDHIEGRFRPIPTIQLALVWWLYRNGHVTRRQLRCYFGLHEMAERRCYTRAEEGGRKRKPIYTPEELSSLVGGRGSEKALATLRGDINKLSAIGLVSLTQHTLAFARSPDQIDVEDISGFWPFWDQIPNRNRTVPVPRRTLRALAAGFSRAVTGVMIALMIRSVHFHKREGEYRHDGRTKGSWIAGVFGISRRAVSDARAHLIDIGWIDPLKTTQLLMNRYGNHDLINVDWSPTMPNKAASDHVESASPARRISGSSASPIGNRTPSSTKIDSKTRKPGTMVVPGRAMGTCNRKRRGTRSRASVNASGRRPSLSRISRHDLRDTQRLLELHRQAVAARLIEDGDRGRLDFLAFAERARSRGRTPEALFAWLLRRRKFDFIAQADEDAAVARLSTHLSAGFERSEPMAPPAQTDASDRDKVVRTCLQLSRRHKVRAFTIAAKTKGWSLERWIAAKDEYEARFGTTS